MPTVVAAGRGNGIGLPRVSMAVFRPATWVALSVLLLGIAPPEGPSATVVAAASDMALIVAALLAVRVILASGQMAVVRSVPAVGMLATGLVSLVVAAFATNFPQNVVGGLRFFELFCLAPLAVMVALRTRTDALVILGSLVGFGLIESALGMVQFVTGTGAGLGAQSIRAVGTFGAYNIGTLAHLIAMCYVICLAGAVVLRGALRWWGIVGAVVFLLANATTLNRSAWAAMAVATVVVVSRGRPARLLATLVAALLAAALLIPPLISGGSAVGERLASLVAADSSPDQSFRDREALWQAATRMAFDHPLTGVGPRAFPEFRDAYADFTLLGSSDISFGSSFDRAELKSPHNLYLLVASEQGLIALFVYATVFAVLLARGLVRAARQRSDVSTAVALMGTGLLSYELIVMVTGDIGGPGSIPTAITLGMAAWAALDMDLHSPPGSGGRSHRRQTWRPRGARVERPAKVSS